ncbi:MAG TPA: hemerythrin domain-containing protein [Acidimicrobiales bacterium]|nr:hemerythrin domain-containing protein [Acidimicrobiales bacterium]
MAHLTRFLLQDHARINRAFDAYSKAPTNLQSALAACAELEVHATIEEELVYPILRDEIDADAADHGEEEHAEFKELMAAVQDLEPGDPDLPVLMEQLMRTVAEHVEEEETQVIPRLQAHLGGRVWDVGREAFGLRQELLGEEDRPGAQPKPVAKQGLSANAGWSGGSDAVPNAGW